jgi:hypothetical protein
MWYSIAISMHHFKMPRGAKAQAKRATLLQPAPAIEDCTRQVF